MTTAFLEHLILQPSVSRLWRWKYQISHDLFCRWLCTITDCTSVMSPVYDHNYGWCITVVHASCQSYCMLISDPTRRASLQTIECIITVHVLTFEACCASLCMCMHTLRILTALIGYTCAELHCYERCKSSDWHHRSRSEQKSYVAVAEPVGYRHALLGQGVVLFLSDPNSIDVLWHLPTWWWLIASEQHTVFCCTHASID